jgi:hypothetical protein
VAREAAKATTEPTKVRDRILASVNGAVGGTTAGLTLTMARDAIGFRFGPPKDPIRFAVGEPGLRSTVWRVWANLNKSDVYLASRRAAGISKFSLHESGDWRQQWVREDPEHMVYAHIGHEPVPDGRILNRWERPPANKVGWTHALSIWVPKRMSRRSQVTRRRRWTPSGSPAPSQARSPRSGRSIR